MAIARFLLFWALNTLLLWVASNLFASISFSSTTALAISGLLFGLAQAVIKPILIVLTFPVTVVTLGLFLLIINGLILLLVAWVVPGFHLGGFWHAVGIGIFVSFLSWALNVVLGTQQARHPEQ